MGQARKRGTYEQRVVEGIASDKDAMEQVIVDQEEALKMAAFMVETHLKYKEAEKIHSSYYNGRLSAS